MAEGQESRGAGRQLGRCTHGQMGERREGRKRGRGRGAVVREGWCMEKRSEFLSYGKQVVLNEEELTSSITLVSRVQYLNSVTQHWYILQNDLL